MTGTEPRHAQGTPCWASLAAPDLDAAENFYGPLLGWEFVPGLRGVGPYVRALADGRPVAGIGVLPYRSGLPVNWVTYFAVDSADEVAQRIRDHGGTVAVGPLDSEHAGRLAVASDPQGAAFGLWEARELAGWPLEQEAGVPAWSELVTADAVRAAGFYQGVFGPATVAVDAAAAGAPALDADLPTGSGGQAGGSRPTGGDGQAGGGGQAHWRIHFTVADADGVAQRAQALGGRIELSARDTGHGRSALLRDPQGGPFAVVQPSG